MNQPRLIDSVRRAPRMGAGLSPVWMVVVCMVLAQVLHDGFGWLEDEHVRIGAGFATGVMLMIIGRLVRSGRA